MYIKDSSFYGYVRDTTDLTLWFLHPQFISLYCESETAVFNPNEIAEYDGSYFLRSGEFERTEYPFIMGVANEGSTLKLTGVAEESEGELAVVVVFANDENGMLCAPPDFDKVSIFPITPGAFEMEIVLPQGEHGVQIESIHVCEYLKVDSSIIENITLKEKNDIILSSIPYNNLELTLFDEEEQCADFIVRAKRHFRALSYFRYNEIHSQCFLHFYSEDPNVDRNQNPYRTTIKLIGLLGAMSKDVYHNTSDGETDPATDGFTKTIGSVSNTAGEEHPSYLDLIVSSFNSNGMVHSELHGGGNSSYGGSFAKLKSLHPFSYKTSQTIGEGTFLSSVSNQLHYTRTPADGYTYADALRLMINAQCHGMLVKNETIISNVPENLYRESGAVFTAREYYSVPKETKYPAVDIVKFETKKSALGEVEILPPITIDLAKDGVFGKDVGSDFVRYKNFVLDKSIAASDFNWDYTVDSGDYPGDIRLEHKGSVISVMWEDGYSGNVTIYLSGRPIKAETAETFTATFGSGTETLEISNPFLRPRDANAIEDIPDHYAKFNLDQQANKSIYELEVRGRFDVHPLDWVLYQNERGDLRQGIVIEHNLTYTGSMRSTFRVIDGGEAPPLYDAEHVLCSETLICREGVAVDDSTGDGGSETTPYTALYSGDEVNSLSSHLLPEGLSIQQFDSFMLALKDESGAIKASYVFSNPEFTIGNSILVYATETIAGEVLELSMQEGGSQLGNYLDASWSVTINGEMSPFLANVLYGFNKQEVIANGL